MPTAIEFNNISKQYRLGLVSTKTISHDLNRWWQTSVLRKEDPYLKIGEANNRAIRGESEYVWALRDIDFKVEQGDVLGIIGKNGAGKSTLLKILSKVTAPTTGSIRARGRIASLLEVGTGFHPEMTGRENIYMNGAIMGMTKREISRKLDEIIDFAGVERYIDTPTKRYSSGMTVRLGFAIAAHLDPEILVVDEVLAVGDAEFQKKAIGKMQDVSKGQGRTVLFVSHNMASMKQLCTSGVLLENGGVAYSGSIHDTVSYYVNNNQVVNSDIIESIKKSNSEIFIDSVSINGSTSNIVILNGIEQRTLKIVLEGSIKTRMKFAFEAQIYDTNDVLLASFCPCHTTGEMYSFNSGRMTLEEAICLPYNITNGEYYLQFQLTIPNVSYLLSTSKPIKIRIDGLTGPIGRSLDYKSRGLLILGMQ